MSKIDAPSVENERRAAKPVLTQAKLYQGSNSLQKRDARESLEQYGELIKWKAGARVLDIGCGDGGVTAEVLRPRLPADFEALVGCDIAPQMVAHANLHHRDGRVRFAVADVVDAADQLGPERFHHVFSFYTLHWVQEQEKALRNIHTLLEPGGDCLLVFLAHIPTYDIYRTLAADPTYADYMHDLEDFISPYHDCAAPEVEFSALLDKCGFRDVSVQCKKKVYMYNGFDNLKKALRAVNPFHHRLTPALREQFLEDYLKIVRSRHLVTESDSCATITTRYTLLVAYAAK